MSGGVLGHVRFSCESISRVDTHHTMLGLLDHSDFMVPHPSIALVDSGKRLFR